MPTERLSFRIFNTSCVIALPPPPRQSDERNVTVTHTVTDLEETRDPKEAVCESGVYRRPDAA
jgi:hypothetical protein